MSIKIIGIGKGLPKRSVTNGELSEFIETDDKWISSRTGINSRFIAMDETITDFSVLAAENALKNAGIAAEEIDLIICPTLGGDYITPSLACTIAEQLSVNCPAVDINAACAGFVYALDIASLYISTGRAGKVLIVCAEHMSRIVDWTDRRTCVLFGDGAGAAVVTAGDALKYVHFTTTPTAATLNKPFVGGNSPFATREQPSGYLNMDGGEVFKFAVTNVERAARRALETLELQPENIDHYVLHQANKRIIDAVRVRLGVSEERFPINIGRYGNTSSATIPILLDEMLAEGKIKKGERVFMSAFGAGLVTASCVMIWE